MTHGSSIGYNSKKNRRWYLINKAKKAMLVPSRLYSVEEALQRAGL